MFTPLILTVLAGSATFIGALLAIIGKKPSDRVLAFAIGFAAGIMLLISLMEMLPAALQTHSTSPILIYSAFIVGLLGYFLLDHILPHQHPQDNLYLTTPTRDRSKLRRTTMLLTLGISLHNFPEGMATYVTATANLELGMGIALAVALHNIPEGLVIAGPIYATTGSRSQAVFWASLSGVAEILGGLLAALFLGPHLSMSMIAIVIALVAGIMVALSIDELIPLAKELDPRMNPSYGILAGMSLMGLSLAVLQSF